MGMPYPVQISLMYVLLVCHGVDYIALNHGLTTNLRVVG